MSIPKARRGRPRLEVRPIEETHVECVATVSGDVSESLVREAEADGGSVAMVARKAVADWIREGMPERWRDGRPPDEPRRVYFLLPKARARGLKAAAREMSRGLCWLLGKILESRRVR